MDLHVLSLGPIATNAYLLTDRRQKEAILVDAPPGAREAVPPILQETGCRITSLLLTHGHWDHMLDMNRIRDLGATVYAHPDDRSLFEDPKSMAAYSLPGLTFEPGVVDVWLEDRQVLDLLGQKVEVRHVPGHAPGNVTFLFPEMGWAFVGDTLFAGGVGRFDLPGGSWDVLERSIRQRLFSLPDETRVFPGHGPETTIGHEKATNPFVSNPSSTDWNENGA